MPTVEEFLTGVGSHVRFEITFLVKCLITEKNFHLYSVNECAACVPVIRTIESIFILFRVSLS